MWEVTSSLGHGHSEEGEGVGGTASGDHDSPGYPQLRSRRGSQCRPPSPASPGQSLLGPCPGCTTRPAGPQLLSSRVPAGHWNPGLTASPADSPPLLDLGGATHHALGSPVPRPSHPHLHFHLPGREEDGGPAPHGTIPVPHGWGQPYLLRAWDGICGPGQLRAWAPPAPAPPSFSLIGQGWAPGGGRR